ncbi:choline dehydrogenase 7 [Tritrichomonas musculus]|uniref:Choline dehydrogenase 7 n=1 Tax=Tritrichomonas musculus TaxID=1915356 RepID=A0ABR2HVS2_9EUKA
MSSFSYSETENESNSGSYSESESENESELQNSSSEQSEYESEINQDSSSDSMSSEEFISGSEFDSDNFEDNKKHKKNLPHKIIGINQPTFNESTTSSIMYYVKFRNESYRSCKWMTKREIFRCNKIILIYYHLIKKPQPFIEVPFYNQMLAPKYNNGFKLYKPENVKFEEGYITPEKVLSIQNKNEYLVKWLALPYSESTWETDVPFKLIDEFKKKNRKTRSLSLKFQSRKKHEFQVFTESPEYKGGNQLTDYQVDALNWLQVCWLKQINSILADEMGLGKTIEAMSILDALSKWYSPWGPFLVICPLSTIGNWMNEFRKWTNFRVVSIFGDVENRKIMKKYLFFHLNESGTIDKNKIVFDVLLLSYEMVTIEINFIKNFNFMYTVVDEAQKLKNYECNFYQICKQIKTQHFLLMTGTPIQNNLYEIWSLLHFLAPTNFQNLEEFEQDFSDRENPETIEKLQKILRPYIFRRKKIDVNLNLPEKEEIIIEVEMTQIQRTFSQLLFKDNLDVLSDKFQKHLNVNNIMMQLRKLYCHPFLFPHLETLCLSEYKEKHKIDYSIPLTKEQEVESLILASGKTILIDKLLPKLKEGHHKVLIFSQFKMMLDILEDYLIAKRYLYERLDGDCDSNSRSRSIDKFQEDEEIFIFLLSTKAGGLGINLTRADTVIIYDSDWNPQNDLQAQARCHRMGQKNKVSIYRLVTRGSYESELFERASKKLALNYAILDSSPFHGSGNNKKKKSIENKKELEMILKKGAYYIFKDDSNEIDKFCSENIDHILEHRSYTLKDVVSGGDSKFSKVTFNSQLNDNDVNKSDFWTNLMETHNTIEKHDKTNNYLSHKIRTRYRKINYCDTRKINRIPKPITDTSNSNTPQTMTYSNNIRWPSMPNLNLNVQSNSSHNHAVAFQKVVSTPHFISINATTNQNKMALPQNKSSQLNNNNKFSIFQKSSNDYLSFYDFAHFTTSIAREIYENAYKVLIGHGIGASRFFVSEFIQEIAKSLLSIIFMRLPETDKYLYSSYIHQHIPNIKAQIMLTPYKELIDNQFLNSLFNKKEIDIIKNCFNCDESYRVAIYLSNSKLPNNFQFAPEMICLAGWSPIEDFYAITSLPILNFVTDLIEKDNLPFKKLVQRFPPIKDWIYLRLKLIVRETAQIIPKNFSIYESPDFSKQKELLDLESFKRINHHVIHPKQLSRYLQLKILRILYLYGLPTKDGIEKIILLLQNETTDQESVEIFVSKVLQRAIKYKSSLQELLESLPKSNSYYEYYINVGWIKEEAIQAIASNLDLILKVRNAYEWVIHNNLLDEILKNLPEWKEIVAHYNWWDSMCDGILFKITAYFGFLFNSMICHFISLDLITKDEILVWRERELLTLTPIVHPKCKYLEMIFSFNNRQKRMIQLLDIINFFKNVDL